MAAALGARSSMRGVAVGGSRAGAAPACRAAPLLVEAAHKKGVGSSKNGRDSNANRLGCKVYGGQPVIPGNIIYRQRGSEWHAGPGTRLGKDYTVYAVEAGVVKFEENAKRRRVVVVPTPPPAPVSEKKKAKYAKFPPRGGAVEAVAAAAAE